MTGSIAVFAATVSVRSCNWAARNVVHGSPDPAITSSAAYFMRSQPTG